MKLTSTDEDIFFGLDENVYLQKTNVREDAFLFNENLFSEWHARTVVLHSQED
jgi:hypothetical protein